MQRGLIIYPISSANIPRDQMGSLVHHVFAHQYRENILIGPSRETPVSILPAPCASANLIGNATFSNTGDVSRMQRGWAAIVLVGPVPRLPGSLASLGKLLCTSRRVFICTRALPRMATSLTYMTIYYARWSVQMVFGLTAIVGNQKAVVLVTRNSTNRMVFETNLISSLA